MGRLVLLLTSPRVSPGLLTAGAWSAVRDASRVLCAEADLPLAEAVSATGIAVTSPATVADALRSAEGGESVVWLADPADDAESVTRPIAADLVQRSETGAAALDVEVLVGSYDVPGARLLDLVEVMDRLRTECPWDRRQTHRSLVTYLIEETYETVEAVESGDLTHLQEELGDLLLQVMFHSRIAAEHDVDAFDIDDVAGGIVEKLVSRHPHVFAGLDVEGADEVQANWETLKAAEKQRTSVLDGIPLALPALVLADKVLGRTGGHDLTAVGGTGDVGEQLLALVATARDAGVDPEQALRDAVRRLADHIRRQESGSA